MLCLEGLVLLMSSIPTGSYILSTVLSQNFLSPDRRYLIETSHLGVNGPRSLTFRSLSGCGSLYLFLYASGGGISDDG